ncbi:hypothetical protein EFR29_05355 [Lactobacillus delbrueckii subsp. lactis]|nr:hypothetical protein [Lactobacillus delbrueckii subsp. lactis]MCT3520177.1 hypothetical protein [Lactobacillus delbrueckii subsp. lactis]
MESGFVILCKKKQKSFAEFFTKKRLFTNKEIESRSKMLFMLDINEREQGSLYHNASWRSDCKANEKADLTFQK